jgi:ribonuclease HI
MGTSSLTRGNSTVFLFKVKLSFSGILTAMESIIVYTSGTSLGNPGPAASGVYITDQRGVLIKEVKESIGNASATFAEYYGVMLALQVLRQLYDTKTVDMQFEIRLVDELVKRQLNHESPIKEPGLVPMFIEIHNLQVESFPKLIFTQCGSEENTKAARLVAEVLE